MMESHWIEIFRGGPQVDSAGRTHDGDNLINQALARFNTAEHEPPVVIGHPADNAPAYGWVQALRKTIKDGSAVLEAKLGQVVPEFADLVLRGMFKKRSAAFYPDGTLRHVGFLGAAPPAVKGLADIGFREDADMSFEFATKSPERAAQAARAEKYGIAPKADGAVTKPREWADVPDDQWLDPVNYAYPVPDAAHVRSAASYWGRPKNKEAYSAEEQKIITDRLAAAEKKFGIGGSTHMEVKYTEADLEKAKMEAAKAAEEAIRTKMEAEFTERQARREHKARIKDIKAQLDQRIKDGKIPPVLINMGLADFVASLEPIATFQFADGERSGNQVDFLFSLMDKMADLGLFKEITTWDRVDPKFIQARADEQVGMEMANKVNPKKK